MKFLLFSYFKRKIRDIKSDWSCPSCLGPILIVQNSQERLKQAFKSPPQLQFKPFSIYPLHRCQVNLPKTLVCHDSLVMISWCSTHYPQWGSTLINQSHLQLLCLGLPLQSSKASCLFSPLASSSPFFNLSQISSIM